jgi:hypothetical protein
LSVKESKVSRLGIYKFYLRRRIGADPEDSLRKYCGISFSILPAQEKDYLFSHLE